jgi:hypothetical protein
MTGKVIYLHGFASGPGSKKAQYFKDRFAEVDLPVLIPDLAAGNFEKLTISGQLRVIKDAAGQDPVTLIGSSFSRRGIRKRSGSCCWRRVSDLPGDGRRGSAHRPCKSGSEREFCLCSTTAIRRSDF